MLHKRALILIVLMVCIFIFLVSCSNSKEVQNTLSSPEPTSTPVAVSTATPQTQSSDDQSNLHTDFVVPVEGVRPYAVMIDNEGLRSLPQGGLNMAQVIYEVIVEGGETRLMPIFWGTEPEIIGSVRSSRHYFLDYAMEHDAIYVHFGWSPMAMNDISKLGINNINGVANGGEIFWDLTTDKNNWQDSYTSMKKIKEYVSKVKYRTATENKLEFKYNDYDIEMGNESKAQSIAISYSSAYTCGYTYDSGAKVYNRLRKGNPQIERITGKQLTAKNIIIQFNESHTIKGDTAGRQDVATTGSGKGYYVTCGSVQAIKWSKPTRSAHTKYTDEKGNELKLNPGQTWIQIVPLGGKVDIK